MNTLLERQRMALVIGFLVIQFALIPVLAPGDSTEPQATAPDTQTPAPRRNPFDTVVLDGAAAYVVDLRTGRPLYQKNANAQLPLASLTKLMTMLIASEHLQDDDVVTITSSSLLPEGDTGFYIGEQFRARDLIDLTLISSSNDGAEALAAALTAVLPPATSSGSITTVMNERAKELGLARTYFINPTGLDEPEMVLGGAYGSARDVAHLLRYIVRAHPDLLESTRQERITVTALSGFPHTASNTNEITVEIPWLVGSKTGFTNLAGGNLAVIFDVGLAHPVAAVVLGATRESRFTDIQKLIQTTFVYFQSLDDSQLPTTNHQPQVTP
ncbi:serine hydrolase [Candidatus Wolfebacteria bacterium]|nr:serine hydrolase [Candidatus Wolfebacteria bacterium]